MLQPWDTMSLIDLGLMCVRTRASGVTQTPQQSRPLSPLHEPLQRRAKCDPKAKMLSLQSFLREGRVVGPCRASSNLKNLEDRIEVWGLGGDSLGLIQSIKAPKGH